MYSPCSIELEQLLCSVIRSQIPKRIRSSARIGVRERKIGKKKESKNRGTKKQVEHGKINKEEHMDTVGLC